VLNADALAMDNSGRGLTVLRHGDEFVVAFDHGSLPDGVRIVSVLRDHAYGRAEDASVARALLEVEFAAGDPPRIGDDLVLPWLGRDFR
jgi:hypothetical protein